MVILYINEILYLFVAFPVSGMVTIPVSMYQTVVTNLNLQGEGNIPITMSTITAANNNQLGDGANDDDNDEVKCVLNGQASIRITAANSDDN